MQRQQVAYMTEVCTAVSRCNYASMYFSTRNMWICNKTFPNTSKKHVLTPDVDMQQQKGALLASMLLWGSQNCSDQSLLFNKHNRDLQACHCNKSKSTEEEKKEKWKAWPVNIAATRAALAMSFPWLTTAISCEVFWGLKITASVQGKAWYLFHFVKAAYISIGFKMWTKRGVGTSLKNIYRQFLHKCIKSCVSGQKLMAKIFWALSFDLTSVCFTMF